MVDTQTHTGVIPIETLTGMDGVDFFRALVTGDLPHPPLTSAIPMQVTEVDIGRMVWTTRPPEWFVNPMGGVHGGYAMTVLDSALGCAVHSALKAGQGYTTIEAKTNLTRAVPLDQDLRCEGTLITIGKRTATSEARLTDAQGRVLAFGTSTCLIL